uniref:Uncharacterized protein n=1 Tax=Romanomermis culicivorax TaxID=13658 RepID=A0A915JFV0_ROMCU
MPLQTYTSSSYCRVKANGHAHPQYQSLRKLNDATIQDNITSIAMITVTAMTATMIAMTLKTIPISPPWIMATTAITESSIAAKFCICPHLPPSHYLQLIDRQSLNDLPRVDAASTR